MFRPQTISLQCPHCGHTYQTPLVTIIDVQSTPELKQYFLSGQLNASQCSNCHKINTLATPILYHDAENEFLGIFVPQQLNMSEPKRQKLIGDLTKALMDALPPEKRRGYMLTPQQFFSQEKLVTAILGFDGITPEMIAASRRKLELVQTLATMQDDELAFQTVIDENKSYLDAEFFSILTEIIRSAEQAEAAEAEKLTAMRDKLLPVTEIGRRILGQRQAIAKLGEKPTREQLLQSILESDLDQVQAIAVVAQPMLDYQFFAALTERIEQSEDDDEQKQLEAKRAAMLAVLETLQQEEQQALQAASTFLQQLLQSENMEEAVRQNMANFDSFVLSVLAANLDEAKTRNDTAIVQRLEQLWHTIDNVMQEALPPNARLLIALMQASYPDETRQILEAQKGKLPPDFLESLKIAAASMKEKGDAASLQQARHLRNVLTQASLL
ncbi:MAG: hypothetical protein GXP37_10465 [Chloroflexi bacterium]|nr:hypothetical protein [Chloroflexota bacterium]